MSVFVYGSVKRGTHATAHIEQLRGVDAFLYMSSGHQACIANTLQPGGPHEKYINIFKMLCGWIFCLHVCFCSPCMPTEAKTGCQIPRASDPLELAIIFGTDLV